MQYRKRAKVEREGGELSRFLCVVSYNFLVGVLKIRRFVLEERLGGVWNSPGYHHLSVWTIWLVHAGLRPRGESQFGRSHI
jgi:hypothetical protein